MLKRLFKGKSLSEFETVLSCARIVPGHVRAKIRRCRKTSFIDFWILCLDFLLRLSPFRRWDIEQNGSAWVRSRKDNICARGPSHSYGLCHNGTEWPPHPPDSPRNESLFWDQEYVPSMCFSGRSSRKDCPDSWQWWVKAHTHSSLNWFIFDEHSPSPIQRGRPS